MTRMLAMLDCLTDPFIHLTRESLNRVFLKIGTAQAFKHFKRSLLSVTDCEVEGWPNLM